MIRILLFIFCSSLITNSIQQNEPATKLLTFDSINSHLLFETFRYSGLKRLYNFGPQSVAKIQANSSAIADKVEHLEQRGCKVLLEDDIVFQLEQLNANCTSDIYESSLAWHLNRINQIKQLDFDNGPYFFNYTAHDNGDSVRVYVIDTGIRITHEEFYPARASYGYEVQEVIDVDGNETDYNGHGTHVAGLIGGVSYGVAKQAEIISVKCLNRYGSGSLSSILEGLEYVKNQTEEGSMKNVINLSFTARGDSGALEAAVKELYRQNVVIVSAAGT